MLSITLGNMLTWGSGQCKGGNLIITCTNPPIKTKEELEREDYTRGHPGTGWNDEGHVEGPHSP